MLSSNAGKSIFYTRNQMDLQLLGQQSEKSFKDPFSLRPLRLGAIAPAYLLSRRRFTKPVDNSGKPFLHSFQIEVSVKASKFDGIYTTNRMGIPDGVRNKEFTI